METVKRFHKGSLIVISLSFFCLFQTENAFAERGPGRPGGNHFRNSALHYYPSHHYYRALPLGYAMLRMADAIYYYCDGLYYRQTPSGYVVVQAPLGATVTMIPPGYRTIVSNDVTYYSYDRSFYVQEPQGYKVVSAPPAAVAQNPAVMEAPEKTIVVNVPNPNGSYIPITLKKYSDGYEGPNGEYYREYPAIDQLKAMYSISSAAALAPQAMEELMMEVPNTNGSYTKVKLVKSQDGYVGPKGEFYPKKPTVEQLKEMYAKS